MLCERAQPSPEGYPVFEHNPRFWRLAEAAERPGGPERAPLVVLSWLYCGALSAYLAPYRLGVRKPNRISTPVVSVGNLVLGGTGKTPVVRWLCESLIADGVRPCVVSYGYGGSACSSPTVVSDGSTVRLSAAEAGDEPAMLARLLPTVQVVVGKRRFTAASLAEERFSPDLVVLDDGFQHWQLHRDLDIVVLDARRPFGNGRTIPAGPMREPKSALRRADVVIISHSDAVDEQSLAALRQEIEVLSPGSGIYRARYADATARPLNGSGGAPDGATVCALSSIGAPSGFEKIAATGFALACAVRYPDHHPYTSEDLDQVVQAARRSGASAIVTTEKDAVRWPASQNALPVSVLDVCLRMDSGRELLERVRDLLVSHGA